MISDYDSIKSMFNIKVKQEKKEDFIVRNIIFVMYMYVCAIFVNFHYDVLK